MTESEKYFEEKEHKLYIRSTLEDYRLGIIELAKESAKLYHKEQLEAKIKELEGLKYPLSKELPSRDYSTRDIFNRGIDKAIKTLKA